MLYVVAHVQVSVLEGALDCWVFLSCLEVLHRIEGCCDQAQLAANCSHTVGLWAYATDKVTQHTNTNNLITMCHDTVSGRRSSYVQPQFQKIWDVKQK